MWTVDVEADSLLNEATTIWVVAAKELNKDNWVVWTHEDNEDITSTLDFLNQQDALCFHNGIAYDRPLVHKLCNYWLEPKLIDTLVMSKVLYPDRPGGHSVENLAKYFGLDEQKVEQNQWSEFEQNMVERACSDVRIQEKIYQMLLQEAKK